MAEEGETKPLPRRRASKKPTSVTKPNGMSAKLFAGETAGEGSELAGESFNEIEDLESQPIGETNMAGEAKSVSEQSEAKNRGAIEAAKTALATNAELTQAQKDEQSAALATALRAMTVLKAVAPEPTTDELIDLARRQRRIDAGLGVLAAIVGGLWSLYRVLSDPDFQKLLEKDLNPSVKSAITGALNKVLEKLDPYFSGLRKFQEKGLQEKTHQLFDASVDIAYAIVELNEPEEQEAARKRAESLALTMGMVKEGMPLVLAAADIVQKCMEALACKESHKKFEGAQTKIIGEALESALKLRSEQRAATYTRNVEKGYALLAAQSA